MNVITQAIEAAKEEYANMNDAELESTLELMLKYPSEMVPTISPLTKFHYISLVSSEIARRKEMDMTPYKNLPADELLATYQASVETQAQDLIRNTQDEENIKNIHYLSKEILRRLEAVK